MAKTLRQQNFGFAGPNKLGQQRIYYMAKTLRQQNLTFAGPRRARYANLADSGSQSEQRICFILPAHRASHITKLVTTLPCGWLMVHSSWTQTNCNRGAVAHLGTCHGPFHSMLFSILLWHPRNLYIDCCITVE